MDNQEVTQQPKQETTCFISLLPSEILDSIFIHSQQYSRFKNTLRLVCRQWKTIVDANPYLWTRVRVGISASDRVVEVQNNGVESREETERAPIEFYEELMKKSGDLMIRVCVVISEYDESAERLETEVVEGAEEEQGVEEAATTTNDTTATNQVAFKKAQEELTSYFHGIVSILATHIHRWTKFELFFVSKDQSSSSIPNLISTIPLSDASNLHSIKITSNSIAQVSGMNVGNQNLVFSIVSNAPPSVRRLIWRGNTPNVSFLKYQNWGLLTHVVLKDTLALDRLANILAKCQNAKTIQLATDLIHAGFVLETEKDVNLPNLEGLTIDAGIEVFQMLEMCVQTPKLGVLVISVPHPVPVAQWPDVPGAFTIRNAWSRLITFLERCPALKVLQLHDPHGALPVDMIVDLMYSVPSALAVFVVVPGEEWIARPEVDDLFWKRLKEVKHPREEGVVVSKLRDGEGKDWMSFGWYVEPEAEMFLRNSLYVRDTSFRWDILDENHI